MNTQVFFIMLVLLSFTLAFPQSAGNTLFRRGGCESGGVCLKKRLNMSAMTLKQRAYYKCAKRYWMKDEPLCDAITDANAKQVNDRSKELKILFKKAKKACTKSWMEGDSLCKVIITAASAQKIIAKFKEKNKALKQKAIDACTKSWMEGETALCDLSDSDGKMTVAKAKKINERSEELGPQA
jgi:hypothetical protein